MPTILGHHLRFQKKVGFKLSSSSCLKKKASDAEEEVEAPTSRTSNVDDGTNPMCYEDEDKALMLSKWWIQHRGGGGGENKAGGSNSSGTVDKVPTLEALICRIVKEAKKPVGDKEVSKENVADKPRGHSKPRGWSPWQEARNSEKSG